MYSITTSFGNKKYNGINLNLEKKKQYAFVQKDGDSFQVRQGNTNVLLETFSGPDAEQKAKDKVSALHKEHKPDSENKGKTARTRENLEDDPNLTEKEKNKLDI